MPLQPLVLTYGCRVCKKDAGAFFTIRFTDRTGWCSQACYEVEAEKMQAEERKQKEKVVGIRVM